MRETEPRLFMTFWMRSGPWWLKPLWSLRQQVEVRRMFREGTGWRQGSSTCSSSHFMCWRVMEAETIAKDS